MLPLPLEVPGRVLVLELLLTRPLEELVLLLPLLVTELVEDPLLLLPELMLPPLALGLTVAVGAGAGALLAAGGLL